jgi:hypothetical protein
MYIYMHMYTVEREVGAEVAVHDKYELGVAAEDLVEV